MNNERRKEIKLAISLLEAVKDKLADAQNIVETERDGEREYYDNMPENLQQGDRGQAADAAADALGEVFDALDGLDVDDLITKLNEAEA